MTHEQYVERVRQAVLERVAPDVRERVASAKLTYGAGSGAYRGICYYDAWKNGHGPEAFVEIAASGEENPIQLAGTTVHELGHVLAGKGAGHGQAWKMACDVLGLRLAKAAGMAYQWANFAPDLREQICTLPGLKDGFPQFFARGSGAGRFVGMPTAALRPCPLGVGVRGGKSRGAGSGSRLRLYVCQCPKPVKVRVASDEFLATCKRCRQDFARPEVS